MLIGDGGTCRHIITGQYILTHHAIPTTNYVFALAPNSPWLTHELLSDLILGLTMNLFGVNGVVLIGALAIGLVLTWSYQFARLRGLGTISGLLLLILAMTAMTIHWSARAHVFSYVPFMIVYYIEFVAKLRRSLRWPLLALTMCVWANLHGSFIIGLFMISCRLAEDLVLLIFKPEVDPHEQKDNLKLHLVDLLVAFIGAACNIRGFNFLLYVASYATNPVIKLHNDESRALDFSVGVPIYAFLLLFALVSAVCALLRKRPTPAEIIFGVSMFLGSLYAMRLVPYFSLIALPLIAPGWSSLQSSNIQARESGQPKLISRFMNTESRINSQESTRWQAHLPVYLLSAAQIAVWLWLPIFKLNDFDPQRLPVDATTWMSKAKLPGLGFNPDNWGDYLYWRLQKPVFIDDKGDFYSPEFVDQYVKIFVGAKDWQQVADRYKLNWLLLPNALPLVSILSQQQPQWKLSYRDSLVSVFLRNAPL